MAIVSIRSQSIFKPDVLKWIDDSVAKKLTLTGKTPEYVWVCAQDHCQWWGWSPGPHYSPDGSITKHEMGYCFSMGYPFEANITAVVSTLTSEW